MGKWGFKGVTKLSKKGKDKPFRAVIKMKSGSNRVLSGFKTAKDADRARREFITDNKSKVHKNELAIDSEPKKSSSKKVTPKKTEPKKKLSAKKKSPPKPVKKKTPKKTTPKTKESKPAKKKASPKKKPTPKRKSPIKKAEKKTTPNTVAKENRLPGTTQIKKTGKWRGVITLKSGSKKTFGMFDTMEEAYDVKEEWKKKKKALVA